MKSVSIYFILPCVKKDGWMKTKPLDLWNLWLSFDLFLFSFRRTNTIIYFRFWGVRYFFPCVVVIGVN